MFDDWLTADFIAPGEMVQHFSLIRKKFSFHAPLDAGLAIKTIFNNNLNNNNDFNNNANNDGDVPRREKTNYVYYLMCLKHFFCGT